MVGLHANSRSTDRDRPPFAIPHEITATIYLHDWIFLPRDFLPFCLKVPASFVLWGRHMKSIKLGFFGPPCPHSATDLHYEIHATSLTSSALGPPSSANIIYVNPPFSSSQGSTMNELSSLSLWQNPHTSSEFGDWQEKWAQMPMASSPSLSLHESDGQSSEQKPRERRDRNSI